MSGFLAHLASVALGRPVEGAARPSLPPRYAFPETGGSIPEAEEVGVEPGPTPTPSTAPAAASLPFGSPVDSDQGSARAVAPPVEPAPLLASEAFVGPITVAIEQGASRPPRVALPASPRSPARAAAPSAIPSTDSRDSQAASPAPAPLPPALARPREAVPVRAASIQAPRRASPPAPPGPTPLAPLSEGAVAGRSETRRPPAPVIHVTIDRIDVRPPAPSRPAPAARRAPAEPSLSLSDFLAAGSPRPRQ